VSEEWEKMWALGDGKVRKKMENSRITLPVR